MKISLNWLKSFVDIPSDVTPDKLGELLTLHTAEIEGIIDLAGEYDNMMIGKILSVGRHPNADKLVICKVDIGQKDPVQIVCGGLNLFSDMLVPVAIPGAYVRWHGEGDPVKLEEAKIRGESSFGMICAGEEIGMETDNPEGATEVKIKDLSHLKCKPGTPLSENLNKNDAIFDVDNKSLTHRPDLWGHYGLAREVACILKTPLKKLDSFLKFKGAPGNEKLNIKIEDQDGCPRFSGCIITNLKTKESPDWIKAHLEAAGVRPINNIVDVTNYIMLELGEPMHSYDRGFVKKDSLTARFAKKDETIETIDHKTRKLTEEDLLICDGEKPVALAGVMGGVNSEINDQTTEIILEAANFHASTVRRTSTRHGLRSDSSQRFEKGLDPALTEIAIKRAIVLLQETCPDLKIASPIVTIGDWKAPKIEMTVDPAVISNKIGIKISTKEMKRILTSLEFGVTESGKKLKVTIPSHRATGDVDIEEDITEEIARIIGYDAIPAEMPHLPINLPIENEERFHKHATRNILSAELGFTEVMNYSFYNEEIFQKFGLEDMRHIKVLNPLTVDQTHMRVSLVPGMLKSITQNQKNFPEMKLFEVGHTYQEVGEFMPLEEKWLIGAVATQDKKESFYEIKGAFEVFQKAFRAPNVSLRDCHTSPPYAHPKKCLEIIMRGQNVGYIFTLHPAVAKAHNLEHQVGIFEVNFTKLVEHGRDPSNFKPLPKFPSMTFDVSLLINRKTQVSDIEKAIKKGDPHKLIKDIELFDIYEGKNIPEDKKSLAFSIKLRHNERTLNDQEFQDTQKAVFKEIEKLGGVIRT
ncbi:phenylalanine--tRNA ligase subunit beta [Candidatus Peregrinibacteria bacterium]|jgi:phenylalanyl-tRNA synthetase beta chain|nr:phenylalanine--tRNA ligase subunit beta [Candidatus Peregrinibacteria bacterium]MBT7483741.1 phenylalanine--tRNA ligase subunit beta [Candidatus Peregrinibacteria bacterium]